MCTCFARLVDNIKHDEKLLKELAAHEMLANTLKLVSISLFALTLTCLWGCYDLCSEWSCIFFLLIVNYW